MLLVKLCTAKVLFTIGKTSDGLLVLILSHIRIIPMELVKSVLNSLLKIGQIENLEISCLLNVFQSFPLVMTSNVLPMRVVLCVRTDPFANAKTDILYTKMDPVLLQQLIPL